MNSPSLEREKLSPSSMAGGNPPPHGTCNPRKKKTKLNKKRFSDEQIKSLESIFENESRLEPRKKLVVARELGLQPRQVAIWFQNKRARWKSKQTEKDYSILQANYNNLATRYEILKKEKQSLAVQLQQLKAEYGTDSAEMTKTRLSDGGREAAENGRQRFSVSGVVSDCDRKIKAEYFSIEDDPELLDLMDPGEGSMTSTEDWDRFESEGLLDQSGSGNPWWDIWS